MLGNTIKSVDAVLGCDAVREMRSSCAQFRCRLENNHTMHSGQCLVPGGMVIGVALESLIILLGWGCYLLCFHEGLSYSKDEMETL